MKEFQDLRGPQFPSPPYSDLASFRALQKWDAQLYGFQIPEAEIRQIWDSAPDDRPMKARVFPGRPAVALNSRQTISRNP
jgi:hypothetical protein